MLRKAPAWTYRLPHEDPCAPANALVEEKFILDPRDPKRLDAEVPPNFARVTGNRSWTLYAREC